MTGTNEMVFRPSKYEISGTTGFRVVGAGTSSGTSSGTGTFERREVPQNRNIATVAEALSYIFLSLHEVGRRLTF